MKDADKDGEFEKLLDDVVNIQSLCAFVLCSNHFAGDFIRPLEILGKNVCVLANVARRLRELVPMSTEKRISRPNTKRDGVKPVDSDGGER